MAKKKQAEAPKAPKTKAIRNDVPAATDGQDYEGNADVTIIPAEVEEPKTLVEILKAAKVEVEEMLAAEEIASAPVGWTLEIGRIYEFVKKGDKYLGRVLAIDPLTVNKLVLRNGVRCDEAADTEGYEIFQISAFEVAERLN